MKRLISLVFILSLFAGCGDREPLPENATPEQVAKYYSHSDFKVTHIPETKFMMLVRSTDRPGIDNSLLDIKELMPELLIRYPDINTFSFRFQKEEIDFLKAQFQRDTVKNVIWDQMFVKELPTYAEMYWVIPALRN